MFYNCHCWGTFTCMVALSSTGLTALLKPPLTLQQCRFGLPPLGQKGDAASCRTTGRRTWLLWVLETIWNLSTAPAMCHISFWTTALDRAAALGSARVSTGLTEITNTDRSFGVCSTTLKWKWAQNVAPWFSPIALGTPIPPKQAPRRQSAACGSLITTYAQLADKTFCAR
jgi:hypothetical protein